MSSVAASIAAHLASEGEGTVGTDIFYGPPRAWAAGMPTAAIYVWEDGGPPPERTSSSVMPLARQTIRVRGPAQDFATAKATADRVWALVERPGSILGTINLENDASAPVYIGAGRGNRAS